MTSNKGIYIPIITSGPPGVVEPPPKSGCGGGGGAPASVISMYLPLLFLIGVYMIYKTKIKPIK